jgi:hypothetical protein
MNAKTMADFMVRVLESSDAQRISFTFVGKSGLQIPIDGGRFSRVARAIRDGTIKVAYPAPTGPYSAFYNAKSNTFAITEGAPISSRMFTALVVHESVHAAFDLNKSVLTVFESEAVAYVAQGFYLRNSGYSGKIAAATNEDGPVYIGFQVAKTVSPQNRVVNFDDTWVQELHTDLAQRRGYANRLDQQVTGDH